jgi:hypothetical protein
MNTEETDLIFGVLGKLLISFIHFVFLMKSEANLEVYPDIFSYQDNY